MQMLRSLWKFGIPFFVPDFCLRFLLDRSNLRIETSDCETREGFSKFREGREELLFFLYIYINTFVSNFEFDFFFLFKIFDWTKKTRDEFFFRNITKGEEKPGFSAILKNPYVSDFGSELLLFEKEKRVKEKKRQGNEGFSKFQKEE